MPEAGLRIWLGGISTDGGRSMAASLEEQLRSAIRDGRLAAGARLPASRQLAADLGVSRGVVVRAYEQLVAEGYLHARQGSGTVVGEVAAVGVTAPPTMRRFEPANPGEPATAWFPRDEWLRATAVALRSLTNDDLRYGDPRGHPTLRRALSVYLGRTRAVVAPPDHIIVTGGFAQGVRLVAEVLAARGTTTIGIEDPGSAGIATTIEHAGSSVRPIGVDDDGIDVRALHAAGVDAVLVAPAHQFPTGAVLAPRRRAALLDWARETEGLVIEDDYDAEYRYDRAPVGSLQGLAPERVVYGGSVSKTLAPALRLGWLVAPPGLANDLAEAKFFTDIAAPLLEQLALAELLDSGAMDRHVRRTAAGYATRRRALLAAVGRHLPGWEVTGAAAGLHAVLRPTHHVPDELLRAAAEHNPSLGVVTLSAYTRADPVPGLVVGYGSAPPDRIETGVAALAAELSPR